MVPAASVSAQQLGFSLGVSDAQAIRTVDQDRLYFESQFGQRVREQVIDASRVLEAENQRLVAELSARETALTESRPNLSPEAFRFQAEAFNTDAERIRDEQERKSREILRFQEAEQLRFFDIVLPLLNIMVQEVGAKVLLDSRVVLLAASDVDLTDAAILQIDAELGDGADTLEAPLSLTLPERDDIAPGPLPAPSPRPAPGASPPLELPSPDLEP